MDMSVKISPNLGEGVAVFSSFDGHFAFSYALTVFLEIARTGSEKAHVVFKKNSRTVGDPSNQRAHSVHSLCVSLQEA